MDTGLTSCGLEGSGFGLSTPKSVISFSVGGVGSCVVSIVMMWLQKLLTAMMRASKEVVLWFLQ